MCAVPGAPVRRALARGCHRERHCRQVRTVFWNRSSQAPTPLTEDNIKKSLAFKGGALFAAVNEVFRGVRDVTRPICVAFCQVNPQRAIPAPQGPACVFMPRKSAKKRGGNKVRTPTAGSGGQPPTPPRKPVDNGGERMPGTLRPALRVLECPGLPVSIVGTALERERSADSIRRQIDPTGNPLEEESGTLQTAACAASGVEHTSIANGAICKLRGLVARADLNGSCVLVVAPLDGEEQAALRIKGRLKVQLCSSSPAVKSCSSGFIHVKPASLVASNDAEWTLGRPTHTSFAGMSLLEIVRRHATVGNEDNCRLFAEGLFGVLADPTRQSRLAIDLTAPGMLAELAGLIKKGSSGHRVFMFGLDPIGHHLLLEAKNARYRIFQAYIKQDHLLASGFTGQEWCSQPQDCGTWQSARAGRARATWGGGQTVGSAAVATLLVCVRELQELADELLQNELLRQLPVWPRGFAARGLFARISCAEDTLGQDWAEDPYVAQGVGLLLKVSRWAHLQLEKGESSMGITVRQNAASGAYDVGLGRPPDYEILFQVSHEKHVAIQQRIFSLCGQHEVSAYFRMLHYCAWRWTTTVGGAPSGWVVTHHGVS